MNVLIITVVGGFLPKFLMQDVHMLMERGHNVHYATNFDNPIYECNKKELEAIGIKCFQIPIKKSPLGIRSNMIALMHLKKIVKECSIDMTYLHNPMGGVLGRLLVFSNKRLLTIYTAHGFHFYKGAPLQNWMLYYPVEKCLARKTDVLITINHEDENQANLFKLKKYGFVSRIPSTGIDAERFYYDISQKDLLRERYSIETDAFIFLSVGELNDNKNHETIIKAFAKANIYKSRLYICGEGYKHQQLQSLIDELGLGDRVVLTGYQTQIENYYKMADIFMFPSKREGMGMAAIEAMACGLPLIVSDNRGSREYAKDNAIVCDAYNIEAFANAMKQLYEDDVLRKHMVQKSIEISCDFTKEKTRKAMEEIMEKVEAQHGY